MNLRIKAVRKAVKKTQKDFGASLGVSRDVYANIENARVEPSNTFIQLLCTKYNVREEWLRTGNGAMYVEIKEEYLDRLANETRMSPYVKDLIKCYWNLDAEKRQVLDVVLQALTELWDTSPKPVNVINALDIVEKSIEKSMRNGEQG